MNRSMSGLRLAVDSAVDLHLHTTNSDGKWTPEGLLDHLVRERFALAAVTDHDRVDTIAAVQQLALEKHLPVLVAVEMTTLWRGEMADLLCYGFSPGHPALDDLAQSMLHRQQENTQQVCDDLDRQGYAFSPAALASILVMPSMTQPHGILAVLKEGGLDHSAAVKLMIGAGCDYAMNEPAAVAEAAHRAGGVCLLAHPGRDDGYNCFDAALLDEFREEVAIDGLEVYHPKNSPAQSELYLAYAGRHLLLVSAGSDSHDPEKPPIKYRAGLCRGLLERLGIEVTD